eukprot:546194-Pelagomonas_calceolata.AAC.1
MAQEAGTDARSPTCGTRRQRKMHDSRGNVLVHMCCSKDHLGFKTTADICAPSKGSTSNVLQHSGHSAELQSRANYEHGCPRELNFH